MIQRTNVVREELLVTLDEWCKIRDLVFDEHGNYQREIRGVETAPLANWYRIYFFGSDSCRIFEELLNRR